MKMAFSVLMVFFLVVASSAWSDVDFSVRDASEEFSESAAGHLREAEQLLSAGDKWRACAEYAAAWQLARAEETRDVETAVRAAGPYCRLLFDFSLLDPLWWVAEDGLALAEEIEGPSQEVKRSIGWIHYWLLMRDRVLEELERGHEHAAEAMRIAEEVDDPDLRAWTRLERSRLYILPLDAISSEVEILRCRAEPLYKKDVDYRTQCELRMEETHLAGGRVPHAAGIVARFFDAGELGAHYRTESFYLLGKYLRENDELVQAVWPLCLGSWLHPDHGSWHHHCLIQRNLLLEGRSPDEVLQLLHLGRGYGVRDATAAIDLEIACRFGDEEAGLEARDRITAVTPEAVSPSMWDVIVRFRLNRGADPQEVAEVYEGVIRRNAGDYRRLSKILEEVPANVGDGGKLGFLEQVRSHLPAPLYHFHRMEVLWRRCEFTEAADEARRCIESVRDPDVHTRFPYLRISAPHQFATASARTIVAALRAGDTEGMEKAIGALYAEAVDPVIVQRTLIFVNCDPALRDQPDVRLDFLNQALAIDHSPVQKMQALLAKAQILRGSGKLRAAEDIYRTVITEDAYLEYGASCVVEGHLQLADLLRNSGRQAEAIGLYKSVIAEREDLGEAAAPAWVQLTRCYLSMGDLDQAEAVADAGIEWLDQTGTHAYFRLQLLQGEILAARGEREAAIEVFRGFSSDRWPDWVRREAQVCLNRIASQPR